ncbi:hypothetical protein BofuT4_P161740.1 [Botrytis cinerea T4]|uniref:Uncharacterized protein n=1 Tax=Botryotinia fuckeliana (strain T4) TaxID=999810 RepID=G2YSY1_BOTF4|nr:hypothetical protein BofuT4_P161740.1 [Botrytis cinerea T4]
MISKFQNKVMIIRQVTAVNLSHCCGQCRALVRRRSSAFSETFQIYAKPLFFWSFATLEGTIVNIAAKLDLKASPEPDVSLLACRSLTEISPTLEETETTTIANV